MTNWCLLGAYRDQERIGGAVVAFDTPLVEMPDGRSDLAVLWDIRTSPGARARHRGTALFTGAAEWATAKACTELKVERRTSTCQHADCMRASGANCARSTTMHSVVA